jgi:hypothetical protein
MSDVFADIANGVEPAPNAEPSHGADTQSLNPETQAPQAAAQETSPKGDVAMAIAELDKMDKFKLDGQEWTLKDLKAAIMRQKDYTQKTQTLSEERKSFQEERKFHENLAWDLQKVRENPALASEFVSTYPQKFHKYVEQFLNANTQAQGTQPQVQRPQVDIQTMSRLERLEKFYNDQQVTRQQTEIESITKELSDKYPDAAKAMRLVLADAYEAQMELKKDGRDITKDDWERIFKENDQYVKDLLKANYGSLVKQQTEANAKGKDVGAGGGTAGRSPAIPKFTSFDQIDKFAQSSLKGS